MSEILFSLPGNETIAHLLAKHLHMETGKATIRHFPDGESYVKLDSSIQGKRVIVVCTLHEPDNQFLPLYFFSQTAKDLGANSLCLVAPYLAYMRQDKRFQVGEGITSTYFGQLISSFADSLITVDPHLHRRSSLSEIYQIPNKVIHAAGHIARWIRTNLEKPLLIGPDSESTQWVSDVAKLVGAPFTVLNKIRHGDRDVEVSIPDIKNYKDHLPVLIDDIISTAKTMIGTIKHLKKEGMKPPVCIGVHAVFAGNAYEELQNSGAALVVTCNTIPHVSNKIDLTESLAENIKDLMKINS